MTAAVAFDKGRAHSFKLRRVLQQTAALCLGSGTFFRCRWIPSEWNAADGPSRGKFVPSEPVREFTDDPPAAGDPSHLGTRKEEEVNTGEKKPPATSTWWGQTSRWKGRSRKAVDMGHRTEWSQCLSETNQEGAKAPSSTGLTATQYPQESFSEQCDPEPVRCPLGGVCSVDTESCFDPDTVAYIRPPFDGLSGASIPAGGGSQSGQLHHGCNHLSGARVERFGIPANGTAVHERMEEVMPAKISDAHPVRGHLFVGTPGMQEGPRRGCPGNDVDLFTLPEAKRGLFVEEPRHCQTSEEQAQGLQALCSGVAPAGGRGPFKDPAVGRDVEPGLGLPEILGPSMVQHLQLDKKDPDEPAFSISAEDVNSFMQGQWGSLGLTPLGQPHLYRLRHGGASHEAAHSLRELTAIQARGRWQTLKSVKNYEKGGRLQQLFGALSAGTRRASLLAVQQLPKQLRCQR